QNSPLPDLIVDYINAPSSAYEGQTISINNTVENQQGTSCGGSYVRFYLSPDTTITTSDKYIGQRYISSLSAETNSSANTSLSLPYGDGYYDGYWYVGAIADATDLVEERVTVSSEYYENNNTKYDSTRIYISNYAPSIPSRPSGNTSGSVNVSYSYTTSASDQEGDSVRYGWDWDGNGTVDEWSGYGSSGWTDNRSHSWSSANTYNVRVKSGTK
ncbi:unnamed protein product, partial [marine sediment metagenome]